MAVMRRGASWSFAVWVRRLVSRPFDFRVPAWDPVGNGAHSVAAMIEFAEPIVRRGADFLGVFVADEPAGLAIVE
ncbi:MAG TPA: hypothetical protein VEN99_03420, partial [Acidimicrobiia bacterium]|nr:hypothetical protein [Acidimicrobiia bacterium]